MSYPMFHASPNEYSVVEEATGIRNGYSQLYRWSCEAIGFQFEAWVSYQGDYSLAKSQMNFHLRGAVSRWEKRVLRKDCKAVIHSNVCGCKDE